MKNKLLFFYVCFFAFFMHTAINSYSFLKKNPELKELRLMQKEMRFEQKQMRMEKKKEEENRHLLMIQKHGCEKQKKFFAHKEIEKKKQQILLDERNNYEDMVCYFRKKMDEKKHERFMAGVQSAQEKRKGKFKGLRSFSYKKQLRILDGQTDLKCFAIAKCSDELQNTLELPSEQKTSCILNLVD